MNRRTAIQSFLAVLAAPLVGMLPRKARAMTQPGRPLVIPVSVDTAGLKDAVMRAAEDLAGIPPEPIGIIGVTYFRAGGPRKNEIPSGKRLFLDGVDVTTRSCETDLVGGWNVMYDVDANGRKIVPCRRRVHRGALKVR